MGILEYIEQQFASYHEKVLRPFVEKIRNSINASNELNKQYMGVNMIRDVKSPTGNQRGITWQYEDGQFTINGTATSNQFIVIWGNDVDMDELGIEPNHTYVVKDCFTDLTGTTSYLCLTRRDKATNTIIKTLPIRQPTEVTFGDNELITLNIKCASNDVFTNCKIKPQFFLKSLGDGTPSNKILGEQIDELTEHITEHSLDGFSSRLPQAEYNPSDYLVVDDGTSAKKISVDDFVESAKENIYGYANVLKPYVNKWQNYRGLVVDVDRNNVMTINGTAEGDCYLANSTNAQELPKGDYILKGFPDATSDLFIYFFKTPKNGSWDDRTVLATVKTDDFYFTVTDELSEEYLFAPMVVVRKDVVCDNTKIPIVLQYVVNAEGVKSNIALTSDVRGIVDGGVDKVKRPNVTQDANTPFDINTFNVQGYTASSANLPSGGAFDIMTFQSNNDLSMQLALNKQYNTAYIRSCVNGAWQSWKRLITEDDLSALADIDFATWDIESEEN